jgi:hypothetical protein
MASLRDSIGTASLPGAAAGGLLKRLMVLGFMNEDMVASCVLFGWRCGDLTAIGRLWRRYRSLFLTFEHSRELEGATRAPASMTRA